MDVVIPVKKWLLLMRSKALHSDTFLSSQTEGLLQSRKRLGFESLSCQFLFCFFLLHFLFRFTNILFSFLSSLSNFDGQTCSAVVLGATN